MDANVILTKIQFFSTGFILGISILHFILFMYWKERKSNLYYSLFLFFLAAAVFFDFKQMMSEGSNLIFYLRLQRALLTLSLGAGLFFFYQLFNQTYSRYYWILITLLISAGVMATLQPVQSFIYLQVVIIAILLDILRIVSRAIQKGSKEIWIIGVGFLVFAFFGSYDLLLDAGVIQPLFKLPNAYQFGVIGLIFSTSIYLAQDISASNQKILEQEKNIVKQKTKREMLQKEVDRTQKELREARELQRSMLPDQLPTTQKLKVAASMRTAAEVGGDYYDVNIVEDDKMTIVLGDATGHGNKAGFMVAITKSLFKSLQPRASFPDFFNKVSGILKQMNLGPLFMAMTCVRVDGPLITFSIAGMPPLLVYRQKTKTVEEFVIKGMPLGAVHNFSYDELQIELDHNDTVLMISDGLHELFNKQRQMFGWDRVKTIFKNVGHLEPDDIIQQLEMEADRWKEDKPIDDDITYFILKYSGDHKYS